MQNQNLKLKPWEALQAQNGAIIRNRAAATQPFDRRERRERDRSARRRRRSPVSTNGATALQVAKAKVQLEFNRNHKPSVPEPGDGLEDREES